MEQVLKNKFEELEGQRKNSMMFSISSIDKNYSKEQLGKNLPSTISPASTVSGRLLLASSLLSTYLSPTCLNFKSSIEVLQENEVILRKSRIQKLQSKWIYIKVLSEEPPIEGFIMSTEGHLLT
ncbi:hypothetical protein M9H77_31145 [Catharanthus roseus]|uniref:Uncharacterized protein n=1 Tax=Catharanthus roseus TaxID=4058 RepID=A0ACC0A1L1_CATRO|nr:hypothetical protein M9H77_31145 [Catharanthus roseus]